MANIKSKINSTRDIDEIIDMLDYESRIFSVDGGEVSLIDR